MAKQIKTIDYDYESDIFSLSDGQKVKTSIDIGDFVLDVNHSNLVCGLEIMDASENLGISKNVLRSVEKMKMSVNYKTNHVYVLLIMSFRGKKENVNIPIPLTLDLGHKQLKKEVLIYG